MGGPALGNRVERGLRIGLEDGWFEFHYIIINERMRGGGRQEGKGREGRRGEGRHTLLTQGSALVIQQVHLQFSFQTKLLLFICRGYEVHSKCTVLVLS